MPDNNCLKCGRESWTMARDTADKICRGHDTYGCVKVQRDNLIAEVAKLKALANEYFELKAKHLPHPRIFDPGCQLCVRMAEIKDELTKQEKINGN